MAILLSTMVALAHLQAPAGVAAATDAEPVAVISLFNPTTWKGPLVIEVPTGSIAAPGLLDWRQVRLQVEQKTIPFAIRAGRAGGQMHGAEHASAPRAEDLLIFTCALPAQAWVRVQVVQGTSPEGEQSKHLVRADGRCTIAYPGVKAVIDEASGALREFTYLDEPLLSGPLGVEIAKLSEAAPYELKGVMGPGFADPADRNAPSVVVNRRGVVPGAVRWVSASSSGAMTEVHFLIEAQNGPSIALAYRVHANGVVEIVADGQPWRGDNPWIGRAVACALPLIGKPEALPFLENRFPLYGFKGYAASVQTTANIRRGTRVGMLELGEETVNGRRWSRMLVAYALADDSAVKSLVEAVDEGPIIEVLPVRGALSDGELKVEYPDSARAVGEALLKNLKAAAVKASTSTGSDKAALLRLEMVAEQEADGIEGDGFQIRKNGEDTKQGQKYSVRAGSLNGLYQASTAIVAHVKRHGTGLPLIARNPVVALRAGGFGGGNFEVDFPYGSDEEWERTLENLAASGMNHFACLGMWGNWKMPVSYAYIPELRSSSPDAYDESSGAKFVEVDQHRERGLRLTRFLHDRGASVWLWMPIGCVPTTFAQKFPEAMAPQGEGGRSAQIPCFTHPDYRRYLDAFFRELLETYPIEGLVLIRDDNGGLCTCERCQAYLAKSRTKSAAWEQYLVIYDLLRASNFKGDVAVYPYYDSYTPQLEPLLPKDLYVVGHGGEPAILTRNFERVGLMGDTWLDNLYANFRLPPSPRMRRLLAGRGSFWIGGAYCGTELPWESIGRFGWEPTATPNTFRYEWGTRTFGHEHALSFVRMSAAYEHLWEINARYLPPDAWMKLGAEERQSILKEGMACAGLFRSCLAKLRDEVDGAAHARWFGHVELFAPFFEYHLHRLDLFGRAHDLVLAHQETIERGEPLPNDTRRTILGWYREIYDWAGKYDVAMKNAPEGMLTHCRWMTKPYMEMVTGYDQSLESRLAVKQFAGTMRMTADPLKAGQPFTVTIELHNLGFWPWVPDAGPMLQLSGVAEKLGLPTTWTYEGEWLAPGDSRTIKLRGTAPASSGDGLLKAVLRTPIGPPTGLTSSEINMTWN